MKAVQYVEVGSAPEVREIPVPEPKPGQIRLRVLAAGLCHSDWFIMGLPAEAYSYPLPLTLGHEAVGVVDKLGEGVTEFAVGDDVAVYGPWGCGACAECARGRENYCPNAAKLGIHPPGLGSPGGMAEYLIVDNARHLVPLQGLDPVAAVALTDAGLTPYHAIKNVIDKLPGGSTAVVIGTGGLGHVGIQILRALTSATVIALDVTEEKLEHARSVGAHHTVLSNSEAPAAIRELTGGIGADVVFDFVGATPTLETARASVRVDGAIEVVGIGGGTVPTGFGSTPFGVSVRAPYWGSRDELMEVLGLARTGQLSVSVERFDIADAPTAYARLHEGTIVGRAVVVP
ncbi:NAD(P)-dependent alcohol dehydrogenase [Mycetocola tolaasinivorans]|uniref:alcohol dehydrogenase n=1 Tax=Mycetocola tolaasinivorans TaxID=76635 RepID=A0A3L7A040_9MICO|nr:NAD(P)-dependent alcohol dehydrogenase [Mycetocola tolaasinivorans]RLP73358.1 NAD(P)-dependent alcohol dehydrogenase [Mycetocola tolaasinivorans]